MSDTWHNIKFDEMALRVEERLDDIFGGVFSREEKHKRVDENVIKDHLENLNKTLLSIKPNDPNHRIEIAFKQLVDLNSIYKEEKHIAVLIRLQKELCIYVKAQKGEAHPLAYKLLRCIFNNMCNIISAKNMTEGDKKHIVNKAIIRYNKLHAIIKSQPHPKNVKPAAGLTDRSMPMNGYLKASNHKKRSGPLQRKRGNEIVFRECRLGYKVFHPHGAEKTKSRTPGRPHQQIDTSRVLSF